MTLIRSMPFVAILVAASSCDPQYEICVTVVSCSTSSTIAGAHVRMPPYDFDDYTGPDGHICYGDVGALGETFTIQVDKRGYQSKTAGPYTPQDRYSFSAQVCLDPLAPPPSDGGTESDAGDGG